MNEDFSSVVLFNKKNLFKGLDLLIIKKDP